MQKLSIEKEYQELHTQIDDNVIKVETDLNGIITYASKQFCKISGYSHKELLGRNVNLLKHSNIASAFFEKLWSELKTNNIWEGEIKNQDRYGNSHWVKGVIFPKYDFDNKIIGYISIRSNITDTKQLEKQVNKASYEQRQYSNLSFLYANSNMQTNTDNQFQINPNSSYPNVAASNIQEIEGDINV